MLASLEEVLQKAFNDSSLRVFFSSQWGSHHENYREVMSAELHELTSEIPKFKFSSRSHCKDMGISVYSQFPVGVDVEVTSRVTSSTLARVSSAEELHQSLTSPAQLWTAKEACFKALKAYNQPSVISQINIGPWEKLDSHIETFQLKNFSEFLAPQTNLGITTTIATHTYSFFVFSS